MAFEQLLHRMEGGLRFVVRHYNLPSFIGKDDLLQEAKIFLYQKYHDTGWKGKNYTYMLTACRFALNNFLRKNREKADMVSLEEMQEKFFNEFPLPVKYDNFKNQFNFERLLNLAKINEQEEKTIKFLMNGYTVRETGKFLGVSHVRILNIKKNIGKKLEGLPKGSLNLL